MGSFSIAVEFSYGWCVLRMADGQDSVTIKNHWLNDGVPELVDSVNLLLDGKRSVSCRWQHEVSGGSFIDLVADPHGGLSIAVHDFHDDYPGSAETIWNAKRGEAVFATHVLLQDFVREFASALRVVRTLSVDAAGMIEHWRYPFPQTGFERLERKAVWHGYKPKQRREIIHEAGGDQA